MKKYWIVSQLFYPDETSTGYYMTKIAEKLLEIGEVNVLCGPAGYHSDILKASNGIDERVNVIRVSAPRLDKNNLFSRSITFIVLAVGFSWNVLWKVKKGDTLLLVTNPPLTIIFIALVKRVRRFKMFVILQDVFPENLLVTGLIKKKSLIFRVMIRVFNYSYRQADHLIACGTDMKNIFLDKTKGKVPISVITNWADHMEIFPNVNFDRNAYYGQDLRQKIVLQFAGNIGRVQGLDRFVDFFVKCQNEHLVLFIVGDGAFKEKLLLAQQKNPKNNIYFLASQSRNEQNKFLNACDIGLVTLSEGMYGLGVPSKVYNIFSAGKPVLYIGDKGSEISNYINTYDVGWSFDWQNSKEITTFLQDLNEHSLNIIAAKGSNARILVEKCFTKEVVLEMYKREIDNF